MRVKLNISNHPSVLRLSWTTQQICILKRMYHKGQSHDKIAQRLNRTPDAIQKALLRFGIRKKRPLSKTHLAACPVCKGKGHVPVNGNEAIGLKVFELGKSR